MREKYAKPGGIGQLKKDFYKFSPLAVRRFKLSGGVSYITLHSAQSLEAELCLPLNLNNHGIKWNHTGKQLCTQDGFNNKLYHGVIYLKCQNVIIILTTRFMKKGGGIKLF